MRACFLPLQSAFGRNALAVSSLLCYVGLGLGLLGSSLALPFGLYVLICQRTAGGCGVLLPAGVRSTARCTARAYAQRQPGWAVPGQGLGVHASSLEAGCAPLSRWLAPALLLTAVPPLAVPCDTALQSSTSRTR